MKMWPTASRNGYLRVCVRICLAIGRFDYTVDMERIQPHDEKLFAYWNSIRGDQVNSTAINLALTWRQLPADVQR
jgi:hypothetical protein